RDELARPDVDVDPVKHPASSTATSITLDQSARHDELPRHRRASVRRCRRRGCRSIHRSIAGARRCLYAKIAAVSLTQYYTATTLDGFIADEQHSLQWLFTRGQDRAGPLNYDDFIAGVGALAMGSTTYEWI